MLYLYTSSTVIFGRICNGLGECRWIIDVLNASFIFDTLWTISDTPSILIENDLMSFKFFYI